jgi:hypothetical protein
MVEILSELWVLRVDPERLDVRAPRPFTLDT